MLKGKNLIKAKVLYQLIIGIKSNLSKMDYYELNIVARTIGNALYDMTPVWSGYKSEELVRLESLDPKTKKCAEHFYPRQLSGWKIIEHIMRYNGISKKKLDELIALFIQVHYTTSEENTRLVQFQKKGVFISPELSYQQANIKLLKV